MYCDNLGYSYSIPRFLIKGSPKTPINIHIYTKVRPFSLLFS